MTKIKKASQILLTTIVLSAALGGCGRQTDSNQASGDARSGTEPGSSVASSDAGTRSEGASGTSSGASGAGTTAGRAIDDSMITTKAKAALLADTAVKGTDIKIETNKGEVTLSGTVDSKDQVDRAVTIVKNIDGVKTVDNRIMVKPKR
jgi:hyperosmotically inducible protein